MAFTVNAPILNEKVPKSTSYTIEWTDDETNIPYTVDLYKNGVFVQEIDNTITDDWYDWTPDVGLTSDNDYTIKVTDAISNEAASAEFILYTLTVRPLSETVTVGESIDSAKSWYKLLSESISIGDSISRIYSWFRTLSDIILVRDSIIARYITTSYNHMVYHVDFDAWTQFSYIDELRACVLTGGSLTENINLILTNSNTVNKYPGDNITSLDSVLKTRRYDMRMGILRRLWLDFTGSAIVQTRVYNDAYGSPYYKENTIGTYLRKVWRGIAGGYNRGDSFELVITNADIIKNAVVDVSIIGKG
uniref:Putative anchor protein n=1 Tax=viral metagenome TaxID=1070528 RepID=A0A6H1ZHQ7_9ZZZZ